MISEVTKLTDATQIVIPRSIRKSLDIKAGDALTLVLHKSGEVRFLTQKEAVRQVQALIRQHVQKDRSLVDELLAERREETAFGSQIKF